MTESFCPRCGLWTKPEQFSAENGMCLACIESERAVRNKQAAVPLEQADFLSSDKLIKWRNKRRGERWSS